MSILLHDGRRSGHATWAKEALRGGLASGIILSPFLTPPTPVPRHPSADKLIAELRSESPPGAAQPVILFDSGTWAATMPGTGFWEVYDQWSLWPRHARGDLQDTDAIADHVRAVFAIQADLGLPFLAPTVTVDTATSQAAQIATEMAAEASRQQPQCIITICGTNSFWRAGSALDAHVGRLARLRPSACYVIPLRDRSGYPVDLADSAAIAGWLRSIRSMALRSRVIAGYTDHLGLIAAAAGASTVGTGWDQGQRMCSTESFRTPGSGGQSISYSPHPGLLARFTDTTARALRDLAPTFAEAMRWGQPIPSNMREQREQHFRALGAQVDAVLNAGPSITDRYAFVRHMLMGSDLAWRQAITLGAQGVGRAERLAWLDGMRSGFEAYVRAEQ